MQLHCSATWPEFSDPSVPAERYRPSRILINVSLITFDLILAKSKVEFSSLIEYLLAYCLCTQPLSSPFAGAAFQSDSRRRKIR
jgi:hypothetical protein